MGPFEIGMILVSLAVYPLLFVGALFLIRYVFDMKQRLAIREEELAVKKRYAEQGDEAIALLKSINENLAHRTSKN
jgi:hypothetical protein